MGVQARAPAMFRRSRPIDSKAGSRRIARPRSSSDAARTSRSWKRAHRSRPEIRRSLGKLSDRPKEARLADPGLARHEQQLTAAGRDLVQASRREAEDVVASDEER